MLAADGGPRDTAYYSILAAEWPEVRGRLEAKLARGAARCGYLSRLSAAPQSMLEK